MPCTRITHMQISQIIGMMAFLHCENDDLMMLMKLFYTVFFLSSSLFALRRFSVCNMCLHAYACTHNGGGWCEWDNITFTRFVRTSVRCYVYSVHNMRVCLCTVLNVLIISVFFRLFLFSSSVGKTVSHLK